ncbi:hypothetical protein B7463_g2973, partial [Scytalidium lignicola]
MSTRVAATTTTAAPAAPALTGGKRGAAYNDASLLAAYEGHSEVSWCYNWGNNPSGSTSGLEYVPMLWGRKYVGGWDSAIKSAIANGAKAALFYNEPDNDGQANIDPIDAANDYKQYMMPYKGQVLLGGPAVTNGGAPVGLTWLTSFISACDGCHFDFIPVHWYSDASATSYFESYMEQFHSSVDLPLWITEFAPSSGDASSFLETVLPFLDSTDYIQRYSYFMTADGILTQNGGLSSLGQTYAA